jgi:hypothetical protein
MIAVATAASAQFRRGNRGIGRRAVFATIDDYDGTFQFCRAVFRADRNGDGGDWSVDSPQADLNLSIRMSELTKTTVGLLPDGEPNHLYVNLTDPVLYRCPFIMMTEVGSAYFDQKEAAHLRDYLLKGGFIWADDFWGEYAWDFWVNTLRKVLPSGAYAIKDLDLDHPIFNMMTRITKVPQIPSINVWFGTGQTSERRDSRVPHVRAISDDHGRIMVLMTHNTDFGDSFEREGDSREYFLQFSVEGYAFGVNTLIYAMTH